MSVESGDHRDLLDVADAVLARVPRGDAEVSVHDRDLALTRFAGNAIHQNVAERGVSVRLRLQHDDRVGIATIAGNIEAKLDALVAAAERGRSLSPPTTVTPLPRPDAEPEGPVAFSSSTAQATPERRADGVATVTAAASARGLRAYGAFDTATTRTVIVNSNGVRRGATTTRSGFVTVVRGDNGSGYAQRCAADVDAIDTAGLTDEVITTCVRNQDAQLQPPGVYEVVLAPYAVAEMLQHLGRLGLSALAVEEGRSFMHPGAKLMSDAVTVYDDPAEPAILPYPFDAEGVTTKRVVCIDKGVCVDVVHDSATAARSGVVSTGHALEMPNTWGPAPAHLAMAAGDSDIAAMIASVRDGIFVTRFWYVREVHPLRTVITGMTREGTFRIRDGRLDAPVKDLRFTQGIVDALGDVRAISAERRLIISEDEGAILAPALHLGAFTFSS